ncbi:MAG: SGNH/GDSL hydrolase family protein, partial [Armatimonadota bacterium]
MANDSVWVDAATLCVEGQGWSDCQAPFDRLPARAEGLVRPDVWSLGQHSSGVTVRFVTDAIAIRARWTLAGEPAAMAQTTLIACCGLDLYAKASTGQWRWVGNSREVPARTSETNFFASPLDGQAREYKLYLPVFSQVLKLEIGVPLGATLKTVPVRPERPIVYYGTSIIHGVGTSRPGMTIPAL